MITSVSLWIKSQIKFSAKINTNNQIVSSTQKAINALTFAIFWALSNFFAHRFCQTIVEVAIESQIVGIKTSW